MLRGVFTYICLLLVLTSAFSFKLWSQGKTPDEEYNFNWLDPDKKIYVIQNRKYKKQNKIEFSGAAGLNLSGAYVNGIDFGVRTSFYISETIGISFLGVFQSSSENGNLKELKELTNILPNIRYIKSFTGGYITLIPFYGKLNLFNKIYYFDWHWEFGAGSVKSTYDLSRDPDEASNLQTSTHSAFSWGTSMKFFLSRRFIAHVSMNAIYYNAPIVSGASLDDSEMKTEYNYLLLFGLGFQL